LTAVFSDAQSAPVRNVKVRLRGVKKTFTLQGRPIDALSDIDLELVAGEFLCIVGPSGCGKTTLLRILAGLESRTGGTIEVARDVRATSNDAGADRPRPLNSMVFQEQSIFPWMSVRDNVAFGLKARGFSRGERYARVQPMIKKVGLAGFEHALPHQLSGGMRQRVSIARAFANDPEFLLMDEPFSALDEQNKLILQAELVNIWEKSGKTVAYVTHSIDEAIFLSDRILVMSRRPGRILEIVDVSAALGRPRDVDAVKSSARYGELFGHIWRLLRQEVIGVESVAPHAQGAIAR
jgi:NitT/TauT family transport system ATP-binding protein